MGATHKELCYFTPRNKQESDAIDSCKYQAACRGTSCLNCQYIKNKGVNDGKSCR